MNLNTSLILCLYHNGDIHKQAFVIHISIFCQGMRRSCSRDIERDIYIYILMTGNPKKNNLIHIFLVNRIQTKPVWIEFERERRPWTWEEAYTFGKEPTSLKMVLRRRFGDSCQAIILGSCVRQKHHLTTRIAPLHPTVFSPFGKQNIMTMHPYKEL